MHSHTQTHTHTHTHTQTHAHTHARARARARTHIHTHTHTHRKHTHTSDEFGGKQKKTTIQYAEDETWVYSFDVKEENEVACPTERGREFRMTDPMH